MPEELRPPSSPRKEKRGGQIARKGRGGGEKETGGGDLQVPLRTLPGPGDGGVRRVVVWEWEGEARDEGEAAAAWLSKFLGKPCRLARYIGIPPLSSPRFLSQKHFPCSPCALMNLLAGFPWYPPLPPVEAHPLVSRVARCPSFIGVPSHRSIKVGAVFMPINGNPPSSALELIGHAVPATNSSQFCVSLSTGLPNDRYPCSPVSQCNGVRKGRYLRYAGEGVEGRLRAVLFLLCEGEPCVVFSLLAPSGSIEMCRCGWRYFRVSWVSQGCQGRGTPPRTPRGDPWIPAGCLLEGKPRLLTRSLSSSQPRWSCPSS